MALRRPVISTYVAGIPELVRDGETGWLVPVELPGEAPRYERAGIAHHHHFRCRSCARVFEIHGCPGDLRELTPEGFRLESHDVTLYGQCARCAAA